MNRDDWARELTHAAPRYTSWQTGKSCSTCGAMVPHHQQEEDAHTRWHQALASVIEGPSSTWLIPPSTSLPGK